MSIPNSLTIPFSHPSPFPPYSLFIISHNFVVRSWGRAQLDSSSSIHSVDWSHFSSVWFSSVAQSCPTLCDLMNRSIPGFPVHHKLLEFTQTTSIDSVMLSSHLILCHHILLLPPIPPSIRVFSNESTLHMRWPKYWSFSFSIIPSKEHPGLISFMMDWLDLL